MSYPIQVIITVHSDEELRRVMGLARGPQQAEPQQAEPQQAEPQQAEPQQAEPQQAEPQQEDLRPVAGDITRRLVAKRGRDAVITLLAKYGAATASQVPEAQLAAYCADAAEALR